MTTEADSEREGLKDAMVLALTMEEETWAEEGRCNLETEQDKKMNSLLELEFHKGTRPCQQIKL
jgi:hypothetical protein